MKIAIFTDTYPPQTNGVANTAYYFAKGLADLGHKIAVFTVAKNASLYKNANHRVYCLPSLPAPVYKGERLTLPIGFSLRRLRQFKPDIIHSHTPFAVGLEAIIAAKLFKIPLVGTHHTFYDHYLKHAKLDFEWAKKLSWKMVAGYYNFCDIVTCPSQALIETMKNKGLKKPIIVFPNAIDTGLFKPTPNDKSKRERKNAFCIPGQSLVYMGRVSYEKSIDQVIRAFAIARKKIPSLKLMIIGDGPERKNLENLAAELKIKESVIFTGFLYGQNLIAALQANDVFLTASKSENMPLSVLEIMAVGLPVIAVEEKGLAEIIQDNVNGYFAATDNPADMAEKIIALLNDTARLAKFGAASRELAMDYAGEKVLQDLESLYQGLLR